ncbi:AEC family transporter [Kushneria aurantia]|uniref:AEC family transporter n=1 Tax=Kushneria aurantia TaxID=504092 RepID=A0ABV6G2W7_9GAMM|nr:AEC family transporter [Kushneria aurantia]
MAAVIAILPIFGLIVLGYVLGWRRWLSHDSIGGLSWLTFRVFLPCVLLTGIARAPLGEALSPLLLVVYFVPALALFAGFNVWTHWRSGLPSAEGLAASYSNNVLIGIPMISALFGPQGLVYLFALLALHSLVMFSTQSLYAALGHGRDKRPGVLSLLKTLANPLVVGLLIGALINLADIELPAPLWQLLDWLARAGLPCALIVVGVGLTRYRLRSSLRIWRICLGKLVLMPLLVLALGLAIPGLNPLALQVLVLAAANPIGVNVLAFAAPGKEQHTVGASIFLSTLLAAGTLPLWMLMMG